ncbi:carotenoid oxygenase family protein [Nodosilinea sp. LEGE 07088]|uniref:carotenoid oxygenase family protein n=1 Tax=Nodosilinea sp. LEGE 07088 TaxID=2777968 RepID=UPI00187EAC59|nr:carotenoid oxygenase family protein [Nodosilinea sp. LEGE 07088]MBE9135769.1 carotenoid oxygenase family protein [Nodosilinea sp. LEGE 07088]
MASTAPLKAQPSAEPATGLWANAIAAPAIEFAATPLTVLEGRLPTDLRGTLYRNGPARFERGGQRVSHWFDGDGAVLRVHFDGAAAVGTYRYVRTAGLIDEEASDQCLYRGYGTLAPGPVWQQWQAKIKNAANTSVLTLPDRLLALWEGGLPHRLDLETLETVGLDDLQSLQAGDPFIAHPKRHPRTGKIFSFGMVPGGHATLKLYRLSAAGAVEQTGTIPLTGIPLLHDFVLADRYLVFCVSPVRLNPLPALFGLQSFSAALEWKPQLGTQVIVVDADSLEAIALNSVDPWYQWHFGHSYLDFDGTIVFDVVRYPDFATNQQLKEVASGQVSTPADAQLWQYRLDPKTAKILDQRCLIDRHCEFPIALGSDETASTYLNVHRTVPTPPGELFGAIARFDPQTGLTVADAGAGCYPSEPIPVENAANPQQPWVLTVVYDGHDHRSELWVYGGHDLEAGPICRLGLPSVVPPSFHGTWVSEYGAL